jgi:hypothetical protein
MSDEKHFHVLGIPRPVRSPDLRFPDFFVWGYFKECVYRNRLRTIQELQHDIWDKTLTINQEMLRRVFDSFDKRWRPCSANEGGHLQDVIYQKVIKRLSVACFVHTTRAFHFIHFLCKIPSCVRTCHLALRYPECFCSIHPLNLENS